MTIKKKIHPFTFSIFVELYSSSHEIVKKKKILIGKIKEIYFLGLFLFIGEEFFFPVVFGLM